MYANEYNHQFPKDFATLLVTEDITSDVFICPDSNDTPAAGPTTQAVVADFAKPGHCSYRYFGAGMHDRDNPQTVVATEPLANHNDQGANVLFLDGHVEFIVAPAAQKLIAGATTQPTVWPPSSGQ
jgi:prepilin-type processing-associated H-X9-DG protein